MKIERKKISADVVRITTSDERWYWRQEENIYIPSVTWICSVGDPKGIGFYKWLAQKGWDESQAIMELAGNKGSKIHQAVEQLLKGHSVKHDDLFNNRNGNPEEITAEEYEALLSFSKWYDTVDFKLISAETTLIHPENLYAGTLDIFCDINGEKYIIDIKTSKEIYRSHKMQLSAYKHALKDENIKLAILQLGYHKNKNKYKFTEVDDCFDLFKSAYAYWKDECGNIEPKQKDFPLEISLKGGQDGVK